MNDNRYLANAEDVDLVALLKSGDEAAFTEIHTRYARILLKYTRNHIFDPSDSEEIIQDTFVWLWTNREKLPEIRILRAYLYAVVKHKISNHIRYKKIRRFYVSYAKLSGMKFDNSNYEHINLYDTQTIVDRCIDALPERCAQAFRLSRFENKKIDEIAHMMKISQRTVENYMTHAITNLRRNVTSFYTKSSSNDQTKTTIQE